MTDIADLQTLPPYWWTTREAISSLMEWFGRHLVALFQSANVAGAQQQALYSGFVVEHDSELYWVTAGHVIDDIRAVETAPNATGKSLCWLDGYENGQAGAIPAVDVTGRSFSGTEWDIDTGVIRLLSWEANLVRNNGRTLLFNSHAWKGLKKAKPEGYLLLGFPEGLSSIESRSLRNGQVMNVVKPALACIPVRKIRRRPKSPESGNNFWNDREAFYGALTPYFGEESLTIGSVKGMSGGPLISVERDPANQIRYRLVGIQRGELRSKAFIRVEPIDRALPWPKP